MRKSRRYSLTINAVLSFILLFESIGLVFGMPGGQYQTSPKGINPNQSSKGASAGPTEADLAAALANDPLALASYQERWPHLTGQEDLVNATGSGRLLFAPTIDLDGNPASNPTSNRPVPVVDLMGQLGGMVMLAVQLEADDPGEVPFGVPVHFRVWRNNETVFEQTAVSDVWGAAFVEFPVRDIEGDFYYQVTAPNFGTTEARGFYFDPGQSSHIIHPDGATLDYRQEGDTLYFTLQSPVALVEGRDEILLNMMRANENAQTAALPTANGNPQAAVPTSVSTLPEMPLPELPMKIVDRYTAELAVKLPIGDYGAVATLFVNSDPVEYFYSQPLRLEVATYERPQTPVVWASDIEFVTGRALVQYEAADGLIALGLANTADVPAIQESWEGQSQLLKVWRTGPFTWQETIYDVNVETHVHDGKKAVALQEFDYDPVSRSYGIAIKSLHEDVITDTLTIEVMGPGDVVIHKEVSTVVLRPDAILHHSISVPAELGKPTGIRVTLDDPLIETLEQLEAAVRTLSDAISVNGSFNSFLRLYADLFGVELIRYTFRYNSGGANSHDFEFPLYDELTRDPWELLTRLGGGILDGFNLNIFGTIWNIFKGEKSFDELLDDLFRLEVGGIGIDWGKDLSLEATADFGDCPEDADVQELEQRLKEIADRLDILVDQHSIDINVPTLLKIPLHALVAIRIKLRLQLGGEVTSSGLTVRASAQGSIGANGRVTISLGFSLRLAGWTLVSTYMAKLINGVLYWVNVVGLINEIINVQIPNGDCDPDPPDPRPPDDRQDVWQGVEGFYKGQTNEETISNINQLILRAQEQGLSRAETLFTLRLREAELEQFMGDRAAAESYLNDSLDIMEATNIELQGILSGTTPISTGQTITEAMTIVYLDGWEEINALSYPDQLQAYMDAVEIGERLYMELLGQELELQAELRQLLVGDVVGVLATGFAESTLSALGAMGIPAQLVSPWPSVGEFRGQPAPYLAPGLAPRAMVVPSGGLHAFANSPGARDWLDAYVSGGGLLVVFSQAFGDDFLALPGGQVDGVGYEEDQRWQHATVEAAQPSDWLVWMGISKPDIQIDGAFTAWPADATILLQRTFGSYAGSPVMIEYGHGLGTVLATTAYGDWAWQTNFWWGDDARLTHSVLIRAYLLSRGQDVADTFTADPASNVSVSFPLTNNNVVSATQARLQIPLVWGTGSNSSVATVPLDLGPGDSTVVNATIPTPPVRRGVHNWTQVGLYRVRVETTLTNGQKHTTWGPFVYVRSPVTPPAVAGTLEVVQQPASLFSTVNVSVTLRNYTNVTRTVTISDLVELPSTPIDVAVPPNGTATQVYPVFMDASKRLSAGFYDPADGRLLGRSNLVVNIAYPDLKATPAVPAALADGTPIPVRVTNQAAQGQALAASLAMTLTAPSGAVVWSDSQSLPPIAAGGTVTPTFNIGGPFDELGTYQLQYRVDDGRGLARSSSIPLPSALTLDATLDRPSHRIRESGSLTLTVSNAGRFQLDPLVTLSGPDLNLNDSQTLSLAVGGSQTFVYPFTVDETLEAGSHEIVVGYQVGAQTLTRTLSVVVAPAVIRTSLEDREYNAGETISVTLTNRGGVDAPLTSTIQLIDGYGQIIASQAAGQTVLAGETGTVALTIPAGASSGTYQLVLVGEVTPTGAPFSLYDTLTVTGVAGDLTVFTGQPDYFSDESINAQAEVGITSGTLDGGNLNLRICAPTDPLTIGDPTGDGGSGGTITRTTYESQSVALSWTDVMTTGLVVAQGDDTYSLINLGFSFEFYGNEYTQAYVSSNGLISFGSPNADYSNSAIPSSFVPNNAIYVFWDDLYPVGDVYGNIYFEQIDAATAVIQWQNVSHCCSTGSPETFQAILNGADNSITLQYLDVTASSSATVGVENNDGTAATQIAYNQFGVINDGSAFRLTPAEETIELPVANFKSYLYTIGDVIFFSYEDDSDLALYRPDGTPVWQGTLDNGQRQVISVATGTYLATGSRKFAIMSGDPVANGVAGYYAADQNGFGVSNELYTWTQFSFSFPNSLFIVFGYEDNTNFTVSDADTGAIYYSGTLNDGDHWESNSLHQRWLHVTADKPVSAYTYYDQGTLVPAADGKWSGTRFYTYAGLVGNWTNDVNVMAFEDDTQVTIQNLDTGLVYWTGTLDSGQIHTEPFGAGTIHGAAYLSITSDKTTAVTVAPFVSFTGSYHQGFYAPDATGSRIGTDLIAPMLSGGTMQIFAYYNDTVVQVYNSVTGALINTYNLDVGESVQANPGYGLWRLVSNKPVSAWAGWGQASAEFAPVLFGSIVVGTPHDGDCGFVLWETDIPVTTATTFSADELVDPLNVTGRLILDGRLYADTGQLLAHDDYPFYLHDRDTALTLETDKEIYRPGQTVQVSGFVTNTSTLTAAIDLVVQDSTADLLTETLTLAPNEGYAYSLSLAASNSMTLTATASNAETSRLVTVADPQVEAALIAPDVAGREPFSVTLVLSNTGLVTASLTTSVAGQSGPSLVLQPGEVAAVVKSTAITTDTTISAVVGGDVNLPLSKLVVQGATAGLDLLPLASDVAGLHEVNFLINGTGSFATAGQLFLEVDGAAAHDRPFAVTPGETAAGLLALDLPAGLHTLTGRLVDPAGNLLSTDSLEVTLLAPAEPAEPQITVANISVSPDPVAAGSNLTVNIDLDNDGASGPIIVGLQLFDPEQQWVINPPAFDSHTFSFTLPVPSDMPAGEYFGELVVDGQQFPFTVVVDAADIEMTLELDREFYYPGETATLTVTLNDRNGVGGDYLVMPRYLVAEDYYTLTIPANISTTYTFTFTATEPDRVNVFLASIAAPPDFDRRVLLLDSLPVPVVDPDDGAYLTFDKLVYDPGDTINALLELPGRVANVILMGPMELAYQNGGFIVWSPEIDDFGLSVQGTYPFSYTLPTEMRAGRYTFQLRIDGETYSYPVDVNGWKVTTRHILLDDTRYQKEDEITAVVEFWNEGDQPINGLELSALIFTPDENGVLTLTPADSQIVDLQPGLNTFTIQGAFSSPVVGPHRFLANLGLPGKSWRVAGASTQFDVGWAHLVELTTDHGNYAPGQPGTGRLDVYGYGPTQLLVTASDGSTVFDQSVELDGYSTYTFPIPTDNVGDYLLVGQSIDRNGDTSQLVRAYAVPTAADLEPPAITLTYPNTRTVINSAAETTPLVVTGVATDNDGPVTVLVNGLPVTPTISGSFSLTLDLQQGLNLVSAVAVDESGNVAFTPIVPVVVVPAHGVNLAAAQQQVTLGQPVHYTVVLTASGTLSEVLMLDFFTEDIAGTMASASSGTVTISDDGSGVTWSGDVPAGQPVSVDIQVTPLSCGLITNQVTALWGQGIMENSNEVVVQVTGSSAQDLMPIALSQSLLDGVQPGQSIGNIFLGGGPGNFGWLSWTGANSSGVLAASLQPPGDSDTYTNPNDPNDHEVNSGDWIYGTPGLQNSSAVRDALTALIGQTIIVPVWDTGSGSGNNAQYHVVDFAQIQITAYELTSSSNRITATYVGSGTASCN